MQFPSRTMHAVSQSHLVDEDEHEVVAAFQHVIDLCKQLGHQLACTAGGANAKPWSNVCRNWAGSFRHAHRHANGEVVLEVMHACGIDVLIKETHHSR